MELMPYYEYVTRLMDLGYLYVDRWYWISLCEIWEPVIRVGLILGACLIALKMGFAQFNYVNEVDREK